MSEAKRANHQAAARTPNSDTDVDFHTGVIVLVSVFAITLFQAPYRFSCSTIILKNIFELSTRYPNTAPPQTTLQSNY